MKKAISMFLVVLMLLTIVPITASAATYSGSCGENLTWVFDDSTGTLTISGTGAMEDFLTFGESPWDNHKKEILKIVFENGVTSIGENAFRYLDALEVVDLGSVKMISGTAFGYLKSLKTVYIPSTVVSIDTMAFYKCYSINEFIVDDANLKYSSYNGVLFNKDRTTLVCYPIGREDTEYTIPSGVTKIESFAFQCSTNITNIIIPDSVQKLGIYSFSNCSLLKEIVIPNSVTSIGWDSFADCTNLEKVIICNGVSDISLRAFSGCSSLKEVTIPISVRKISTNAFEGCIALTDIYYSGFQEQWNFIDIADGNEFLELANINYLEQEADSLFTTDEYMNISFSSSSDFNFYLTNSDCAEIKSVSKSTTSSTISVTVKLYPIKPGFTIIYAKDTEGNILASKSYFIIEGEHQLEFVETIKNPTCTENGIELHKCKFCDYEETVTVEKNGHTSSDWIVDSELSCTCDEIKHKECTVCGEVIDRDIRYATGHILGFWKNDVNATCTEDGLKHKECIICGETIVTESIDKLGHNFEEDFTVDKEPTTTIEGSKSRHCTRCDARTDETSIPVLLNGWINENGNWAFYENGTKVINKWVKDSVGWCYLGANGYCVTNCWKADSYGWCYLDANGRMVCNNWVQDNGKWYFMDTNGYMVSNCWKKDSNGWCYLGSSGAMLTNAWVKDSVGWCYVGANGYCVTNKWVEDSKGWCYLDTNGRMVYNKWVKDSKGWCYVGSSGYMVYNQWVQDSGKWYYIDASGYMVTGTKVINGKTYKFNSSGVWIG